MGGQRIKLKKIWREKNHVGKNFGGKKNHVEKKLAEKAYVALTDDDLVDGGKSLQSSRNSAAINTNFFRGKFALEILRKYWSKEISSDIRRKIAEKNRQRKIGSKNIWQTRYSHNFIIKLQQKIIQH
jgi:hypothetical protein